MGREQSRPKIIGEFMFEHKTYKNLIDSSYQQHTYPMFVFVQKNFDVIMARSGLYIASYNGRPLLNTFHSIDAAIRYIELEWMGADNA
jgi:hypothetical protein